MPGAHMQQKLNMPGQSFEEVRTAKLPRIFGC